MKERRAYSVLEVNHYIHSLLLDEPFLQRLYVEGEVSNVKYHTSGHIYFTLKDDDAQISAVMWRSSVARGLPDRIVNGDKVYVTGKIDSWEKSGGYQLVASRIEKAGQGILYQRYEAMKREFQEMGMFDASYKKPLPKYPKKVGIITAQTGAAVRDIIRVGTRRNPYVQFVLYPALVQGEGAAESVVRGIETMDAQDYDVLIVGRGGGSIEELWAFNEEIVARAIFACNTPIISAVGHEVDFTIADFVADKRAATPSEAAELAVPLYTDMEGRLQDLYGRLQKNMTVELNRLALRLQKSRSILLSHSPEKVLADRRQYAVTLEERLENRMSSALLRARHRVDPMEERMSRSLTGKLDQSRHRLSVNAVRLDGLSPLKKFQAGYAYPTDENGQNISSVRQVKQGDKIRIRLMDGRIESRVEDAVIEDSEEKYGKKERRINTGRSF